jgi:hypothetical protein
VFSVRLVTNPLPIPGAEGMVGNSNCLVFSNLLFYAVLPPQLLDGFALSRASRV